ncbi:unnamed protein product [Rotaria magnacalcarata]|uniref:Uncharacterized protein n=1 Tax=Rotaria magnacalcarata TaxID=392030 RepID=A0A8S2IH57_9BILA|nr:unnamed protein product [Rotaria magnacalcarata]
MDRYIKEFRQVVDESSAWRRETEQALDTSTASGIFESLPEIDDRTKKIELALDTSWNNWWSGDEGGSQAGCGEQTWGDSAGRGKVCREQHGGLQRTTDCERETHYGFRRRHKKQQKNGKKLDPPPFRKVPPTLPSSDDDDDEDEDEYGKKKRGGNGRRRDERDSDDEDEDNDDDETSSSEEEDEDEDDEDGNNDEVDAFRKLRMQLDREAKEDGDEDGDEEGGDGDNLRKKRGGGKLTPEKAKNNLRDAVRRVVQTASILDPGCGQV